METKNQGIEHFEHHRNNVQLHYQQPRSIYTSILQGFSKTQVAEVYIEIQMLQTKDFACARQVKTVKDIAL